MHGSCHGGLHGRMMRFMGRHHRGGWRHRFGGGGFPGGGFDGMMAARKLASGDLQLVILALLAEQPRHGYDIIKELEERSKGFYVPSPGMVYPALTYLEEAGYATVDAAGAKKLYAITETGRAYLAEHQESAAAILSQLDVIGRKMQAARDFFSAEEDVSPELHDARQELRHALREKRHASPAERGRVAEILRRAAAEIRGKR